MYFMRGFSIRTQLTCRNSMTLRMPRAHIQNFCIISTASRFSGLTRAAGTATRAPTKPNKGKNHSIHTHRFDQLW